MDNGQDEISKNERELRAVFSEYCDEALRAILYIAPEDYEEYALSAAGFELDKRYEALFAADSGGCVLFKGMITDIAFAELAGFLLRYVGKSKLPHYEELFEKLRTLENGAESLITLDVCRPDAKSGTLEASGEEPEGKKLDLTLLPRGEWPTVRVRKEQILRFGREAILAAALVKMTASGFDVDDKGRPATQESNLSEAPAGGAFYDENLLTKGIVPDAHKKRRYFTLLALFFAAAFLLTFIKIVNVFLPIGYSIYFIGIQTQQILNILYNMSFGIIIFVAVRYKFRLCLPFAAVTVYFVLFSNAQTMLNFILHIRLFFVPDPSQFYYFLVSTLMSLAAPFFFICVTKAAAGRIKREAAAVTAVLLAYVIVFSLPGIYDTIEDFIYRLPLGMLLNNLIFSSLPFPLVNLLGNSLLIAVAYIILTLVLDKRRKFIRALKKLWDKTAD